MSSPRRANPAEKLTARDVLQALYDSYADRFVFLTEVVADAYKEGLLDREDWREHAMAGKTTQRWIDVLLIAPGSAKPVPYERIAIEIKVTRADFRRDTEEKREWWTTIAHRFAYAVPAGLVTPDEVPAGCGLIEVGKPGGYLNRRGAEWKIRAPRLTDPPEWSPYLSRYFAGRASRAEAHLKGLDWASRQNDDDPVELRRRISEMEKRAVNAEARMDQWRAKHEGVKALLLQMLPQVCADCGGDIRPKGGKRGAYHWEHRDPTIAAACEIAWRERETARQLAHRAELLAEDPTRTWLRETPYIGQQQVVPKIAADLMGEEACDGG